jgi:hypothetical protein
MCLFELNVQVHVFYLFFRSSHLNSSFLKFKYDNENKLLDF